MARAKKVTATSLGTGAILNTTTDEMAKYKRMGYPSGGRQFIGKEAEAINADSEIILPTTNCKNSDIFFCVDTCKVLMFYDGSWFTLE